MSDPVSEVPAAAPAEAEAHFARKLAYETDCWDVHHAMQTGAARFVLLDVRSHNDYERGHVPGAISLPHGKIIEAMMRDWPADALFVVYCAGPHCNGADKAAWKLARLGRLVKVMIGGVTGWLDEGFELERSSAADQLGASAR